MEKIVLKKYTVLNTINGHYTEIEVDWNNGGKELIQGSMSTIYVNSEIEDEAAINIKSKRYFEEEKDKYKVLLHAKDEKETLTSKFSDYSQNFVDFESSDKFIKDEVTRINKEVQDKIEHLQTDEAVAFTDGSYQPKISDKIASGAAIIITKSGKEKLKTIAKGDYNQVLGEATAIKIVLDWAAKHNIKRIDIYFDLQDIAYWILGSRDNADVHLAKVVERESKKRKIVFHQVPAHTGINYNEEVDALAKNALVKFAEENNVK